MRQSVALGDLTLAVERLGAGHPFVWGHGLTSSMQLEPELLPFDWQMLSSVVDVIRYDARGHGSSTLTAELEGYSWKRLAQDQLALADSLDVDRYIAGGASMGAGTALHAAVAAPSRVRALVLVIPPTAWETRDAQRDLYLERAVRIAEGKIDEVVAASRRLDPPGPFGTEWHERIERNIRLADHQQMAHVLRGAATADFPARDLVAGISVPALILAWSGDPGHPLSTAEELNELITSSDLVVASTAEELADWSRTIAEFLTSLS
jgi:3-oxoadipate enol-lactonase